jgi:transposase
MSSKEHTYEFKDRAVQLAGRPGHTIASVAIELKIPAWKLRNWIKESKDKLERRSDIDEVVRLQKENKRLAEELEILKKAAAYFAKQLP